LKEKSKPFEIDDTAHAREGNVLLTLFFLRKISRVDKKETQESTSDFDITEIFPNEASSDGTYESKQMLHHYQMVLGDGGGWVFIGFGVFERQSTLVQSGLKRCSFE
jgi:hypothetical protein